MKINYVHAALEYDGKSYAVVVDQGEYGEDDTEDARYGMEFYWTEGNMGCDCNRSIYIGRYCDEAFPEMECGEEIKLTRLEYSETRDGERQSIAL